MLQLASTDLAGPRTRAAKRARAAVNRGNPRGQQNNSFGELATYTAKFGTSPLYALTYDAPSAPRDALGRVVQKTETLQGATHSFGYTYNTDGRLTEVHRDGTLTEQYGYDPNGNRTSATVDGTSVVASYDDQDRLLAYGNATYTYGANGELRTKVDASGTTSYTYDAMGSLIAVQLPDGRLIEYVTDGQSRRIARRVNGIVTKQWLYRDQLKPVAELDGAGNLVAQFIYGTKSNIPDLIVRGGSTYRIISDQLGSPVLAVNVANASDVPFKATYAAFGERALSTGSASEDWMPFGFAGGLYDVDTGLTRFGARDYDAVTGRWVSKDPSLFSGGQANLYVHVENDPVNRRDPSGLDTYMCIKPLHAFGGEGSKSGPESWLNPLYHQFVCVRDANGNTTCGGQDRAGANILRTGGKASNDIWPTEGHGECQNMDDHACVDNCMLGRIQNPGRPAYGIGPFGTDCQEWAEDALSDCQAQCGSYQ